MPDLHCIVTAGPTAEPLDEVRRMTNASTGSLGTGLGDFLAAQGCRVTLLRSRMSTAQAPDERQRIMEFTTTKELGECLMTVASSEVDAVFHVAAVSDFTFGRVFDRSTPGSFVVRERRKIDTGSEDLIVELKPTPKLINRLKEWFPKAWLVGWKYEMDGTREQAVDRARAQIRRCGTHACVVNGRAYGPGYGLVSGDGPCRHLECATELHASLWEAMRAFRTG